MRTAEDTEGRQEFPSYTRHGDRGVMSNPQIQV